MPALMLDQADAARELGTSRDVVRELIAAGELRIVALPGGKAYRIPYAELVAWVERNAKVKAECQSPSDDDESGSGKGSRRHGKSPSGMAGSGGGSGSTGGNRSNTQRLWEKRSRRISNPASPQPSPDNIVALPSSS